MDDKTEILISLGASTAANCVPCFEYYYQKAIKLGLEMGDIDRVIEIGDKVKTGSSIAMTQCIRKITGRDAGPDGEDGVTTASHPCCR